MEPAGGAAELNKLQRGGLYLGAQQRAVSLSRACCSFFFFLIVV